MFTVQAARGFSIEFDNGYKIDACFSYLYQTDPITILEQVISNTKDYVEVHIYKKSDFICEVTDEFIKEGTLVSAEQFVDILAEIKKR